MSESSVAAPGSGDASARIKRVPAPIATPGCCVICGKNEHPDGFAQTDNFDFEFYGTVYFCADCIGDYARAFGYLSPGEFASLHEQIEDQLHELNTHRQAILGLEATVDGLVADAHRRSNSRNPNVPVGRGGLPVGSIPERPVDEPDAKPSKPSPREPDSIPAFVQSDDVKLATEQGTDDLLDTTSADELLGL